MITSQPSAPISVVLVDDHPVFTRGLVLLLNAAAGDQVDVVGTTNDASRAAATVRDARADVAVVDLAMPPPGGLAAIEAITRLPSPARVVALSGLTDPGAALAAISAGAVAFVPKTSEPEQLVPPLLTVLQGFAVVPEGLLRTAVDAATRPGAEILERLDDDECRLWRAIASGSDTQQIAQQLFASERTAKRAVATLLRQLGVSTRLEAAALAGRVGLLDDLDLPASA